MLMVDSSLPRYPQSAEGVLHDDEIRKNANQHAARGEHDDDPEIQLLVGPVVALADDDALPRDAARHAGGVRASQLEELMGISGRRGVVRWFWWVKGVVELSRVEVMLVKYGCEWMLR